MARTRIKQRKAFDDGCIEGNAAAQCTLHIRVVLSKKLNLHFLFLISSLGYKIKGISSKTCFLNIEKILEEIV